MTGEGTSASPYQVASVADWLELEGKSGYVDIIADIDFASAGSNVHIPSITPGGELYINGNNHIISNFYQLLEGTVSVGGLFSSFTGIISDLNIENAYILCAAGATISGASIGIVAGSCGKCVLNDVQVTGAINTISGKGDAVMGGFFGKSLTLDRGGYNGYAADVTFDKCMVNMNIHNNYRTGGFIGDTRRAGVFDFNWCTSACRFFGNGPMGGFIGYAGNGAVDNTTSYTHCLSQCDFEKDGGATAGFENAGDGYLTNCASVCNIKGGQACYGIGGKYLVQCYAKGTFDGCYATYGLAGSPTAVNCYAACIHANNGSGKHYGLTNGGDIFASFYDAELFGESADTTWGALTANLKSADWLRKQGWAVKE